MDLRGDRRARGGDRDQPLRPQAVRRARGDPRGELIALQLAEPSVEVEDRAAQLIAEHELALPAGHPYSLRFGFASPIEIDPGIASRAAVLDHPTGHTRAVEHHSTLPRGR